MLTDLGYLDKLMIYDTFSITVYNDGRQTELVCFKGTIPVRYKGCIYNIPVCIWLLESHPFIPPLIYVTPTSTMIIKPGKHVDNTGRVYLPYLTDWKSVSIFLLAIVNCLKCHM